MFPSCTGKTREFTSSLGWLASLFIYDKKVRLPWGKPSPAYRYDLDGMDRGKLLPQFNMEQQAELISHYFGATQIGIAKYVDILPKLRQALAGFLENPKNPALLPMTVKVEPNP
jgi:hypothetical protein